MYYEIEALALRPEWTSSDGAGHRTVSAPPTAGYRMNLPMVQWNALAASDPTQNSPFDVRVVLLPLAGTIDGRI